MTDDKWKIVRKGDIYCHPGCGAGCTHAEYCHAVVNADELVELLGDSWLGDGWKTRVWDNLGWHYEALYKNTGLTVFPTIDGKYHACIDHRYHSDSHDDPNVAVLDTMGNLSDAIIDLMDIHYRVTGSQYD